MGDGKVIEDYPEDKYGPSCLILGFTGGRKAGARALQSSFPLLIKTITVYEPNPNLWIDFEVRKA